MYDSSKDRFLIVCLDREVSSFQKIKECAEYKRKIDEMILGKKLAESKWSEVRLPSSRYCETLRDKVSIEKYLIDLCLYGYDIEKSFEIRPYDYVCGGVNYKELYEVLKSKRDKVMSNCISI